MCVREERRGSWNGDVLLVEGRHVLVPDIGLAVEHGDYEDLGGELRGSSFGEAAFTESTRSRLGEGIAGVFLGAVLGD